MKSLDAALGVLACFMGNEPTLGVGEIAERMAVPKSKVSKVLSTFRKHGILEQDPRTRRYAVGARAFALGSRFINYNPLTRAALPVMRELTERSGHSTRLSIRVGDDVLYLIGIEGPHFIDTGWRAGQWMPLHATSAARVILAFLDEQEVARLFEAKGTPAITPHTVTDGTELMAMLRQVRAEGIARNRDETASGLSTISVPVYGPHAAVIAALTLAFPSHTVLRDQEQPFVEMLHQSARVLSQKMGADAYPFGNLNIAPGGRRRRAG